MNIILLKRRASHIRMRLEKEFSKIENGKIIEYYLWRAKYIRAATFSMGQRILKL